MPFGWLPWMIEIVVLAVASVAGAAFLVAASRNRMRSSLARNPWAARNQTRRGRWFRARPRWARVTLIVVVSGVVTVAVNIAMSIVLPPDWTVSVPMAVSTWISFSIWQIVIDRDRERALQSDHGPDVNGSHGPLETRS